MSNDAFVRAIILSTLISDFISKQISPLGLKLFHMNVNTCGRSRRKMSANLARVLFQASVTVVDAGEAATASKGA